MNWTLKYLPEAIDDVKKLNGSVKAQVLKAIRKVHENPLPNNRGGYGKPLGNKAGANLTGLYKIKMKSIGIRVVYALEEIDGVMTIVIVGARSDNEVYLEAAKRMHR